MNGKNTIRLMTCITFIVFLGGCLAARSESPLNLIERFEDNANSIEYDTGVNPMIYKGDFYIGSDENNHYFALYQNPMAVLPFTYEMEIVAVDKGELLLSPTVTLSSRPFSTKGDFVELRLDHWMIPITRNLSVDIIRKYPDLKTTLVSHKGHHRGQGTLSHTP
jgi:hypothetical protein